VLPFEFTVDGPPRSQQSRRRDILQQWRRKVLDAALAAWPLDEPAVATPIQITVVFFHEGDTVRVDNDNLIKPIQDALNGHIYVDDRLITDTHVRKTPLDGAFRVRRMPRVLADAFVRGVAFVYIRIEPPPSHEVLP